MLLLGRLEAAGACQISDPHTDEQLYAKASAVFVGRIFRTEEVEGRLEFAGTVDLRVVPLVEATFRLVEVLKGDPPVDRKIRGLIGHSTCGVSLLVGFDYLIFLNEGSNFVVSEPDAGTRALFERRRVEEDTYCQAANADWRNFAHWARRCHSAKLG